MPLISVIVPVYKVEKYIHRCVDSILAQTFTDFELILVDDGSPDNCGKICDEYAEKDSRIVVIHQENGGLSAARNAGLDWVYEHSDSQWISFVDSDDYVYPQYLEKLYQAVVENNVKISICDFVRFTNDIPECSFNGMKSTILTGLESCRKIYEPEATARYVVSWGKMYHKSLFAEVRFPIGKIHEDQFTTYKLFFEAEYISLVEEPLYGYFNNPHGITGVPFSIKRYDLIDALEEANTFFREKDDEIAQMIDSQKKVLIATFSYYAKEAGFLSQVKEKYQLSFFKSGRIIRQERGYDRYEYFISQKYPLLMKIQSYIRKLYSKIFGVRK